MVIKFDYNPLTYKHLVTVNTTTKTTKKQAQPNYLHLIVAIFNNIGHAMDFRITKYFHERAFYNVFIFMVGLRTYFGL